VVLANTAAAEIFKEILGGLGGRLGAFFVPYPRAVLGEPGRLYRLRSRSLQHRTGLSFLVARLSNFGPGAPPSLVDHVLNLAARTPPGVWTDVFRSMMEMDLGHALRHITVPALVVVGDVDRLTPPSSALAIKRMLPEARMVVMRGAGHCAMLERHEQFTELLEEFLGDILAPRPRAVSRASTPMART
jgi:pimeloyl-ACP methyl ester carboxylesterase